MSFLSRQNAVIHHATSILMGGGIGTVIGLAIAPWMAPITAIVGAIGTKKIFSSLDGPISEPSTAPRFIEVLTWKIKIYETAQIGYKSENGNATLRLCYDNQETLVWHLYNEETHAVSWIPVENYQLDSEEASLLLKRLSNEKLKECFKKAVPSSFLERWRDKLTYEIPHPSIYHPIFKDDNTQKKVRLYTSWWGRYLGWEVYDETTQERELLRLNFGKDIPLEDHEAYFKDVDIGNIALKNKAIKEVRLTPIFKKSIFTGSENICWKSWNITLINTLDSQFTNVLSWGGHAMLVFEGFKEGRKFTYAAHLTKGEEGVGKVTLYDDSHPIRNLKYSEIGGTWIKPYYQVQAVLNTIKEECSKQNKGRPSNGFNLRGQGALGVPPTTQLSYIEMNENEDWTLIKGPPCQITVEIHNCMTWAMKILKIAEIHIYTPKTLGQFVAITPSQYTYKKPKEKPYPTQLVRDPSRIAKKAVGVIKTITQEGQEQVGRTIWNLFTYRKRI